MSDIETKLEKARERAESFGQLYGAYTTADDYRKATYATLEENAPGETVGERDSWIRRHPDYKAAIGRKRDACAEWKAAETYMRLLFAEADVWRTKEANNRVMDRAHR